MEHSSPPAQELPNPSPSAHLRLEEDGGVSFSALLHAVRRRWLWMIAVGVPIAVVVAAVLWFVIPHRYEAVAELLVRSQEERLLPSLNNRGGRQYVASEYDIYRQTQASLITSAFVLNAVLRKPEIQSLAMLDEDEVANPVGYLQDNIKAMYPNDAEVLQVSIRGDNPAELKTLLDAVTDAYLEETVYNRRKRLVERASKLREEYGTNRELIRQRRENIHNQEVQLGARDASNSHIRHQLELEKLRKLDASRGQIESRIYEIDLRLALANSVDESVGEIELPEYLINEELERDERYNQLLEELSLAQQFYTSIVATAKSTSPSVQRAAAQAELVSSQLSARRRQLSHRIEQKILNESVQIDDGEAATPLLEAERAMLTKRHDEVKKLHEEQLAYVRQLDGFSARLETEREELAYDVRLNQARHAEIEDLKVQIDSPDRVLKIQSATIPNANSWQMKLIQIASSAIVAFGLVVAGFIGWDVTRGFTNNSQEVASATQAPLVGKLPRLQKRLPFSFHSKTTAEAALVESIDGIRAAVSCHDSAGDGKLVVMVTSSVGGEGRTTLATYLAAAFARAGKSVLLIDADTQNPQQHVVFDRPGEHGLCDILRSGGSANDHVATTDFEGLSLLPAGKRDATSRRALTTDTLPNILTEIAASYDCVVIDTGPVLSSIEPLVIGQHVDVVLLSAMADVSRVGQLQDAHDRLSAVGVQAQGVVAQGSSLVHRHTGSMS